MSILYLDNIRTYFLDFTPIRNRLSLVFLIWSLHSTSSQSLRKNKNDTRFTFQQVIPKNNKIILKKKIYLRIWKQILNKYSPIKELTFIYVVH
jgi:hypothetical protein